MIEIHPAIIPQSLSELEDKIKQIDEVVSWVHIDVSDGKFTPVETWDNVGDLALIPGKVKVEVHLMIEHPEEVVSEWAQVADRVIVHPESTDHLDEIINAFEHSNSKLGLSLLLDTPILEVEKYLDKVDMIQLMSIQKIGYQGEGFQASVLDKISSLREIWPDGLIQVDGGVDLNNVVDLEEMGANSVAVGSALWQAGDVVASINKFREL